MAKSKRPKRTTNEAATGSPSGEDEPAFRLRPRSPHGSGRAEIDWSNALRSVFHYARSSAKSSRAASSTSAGNVHPRRSFCQRCAVRVTYSPNKTAGQWRAHGIYIARESASGDRGHGGFGKDESAKDPASTLDKWQAAGDERIWKVILSPEFGDRIDLQRMTRDVMHRSEQQLGTTLEWTAVSHFNTEHPHVHVVIRGRRDDGTPLNLPRDFVKQGFRNLAENACTLQLGPRTELDAFEASQREVNEHRYTALDRALERRGAQGNASDSASLDVVINRAMRSSSSQARSHEQHLQARLLVLRNMGLADQLTDQSWRVRRDFATVLRAMQLASDRQRMLASKGSLLSDERLQLSVFDFWKTPEVQGRILVHGEEEQSVAGRHYMLLEGTDAQIHMIFYTPEMEQARSTGKLKPNSFVHLRKQTDAGQAILMIQDLGDANALLKNKAFISDAARRLLIRGIIPSEEGWGGWLGRYQSAVCRSGKAPDRRMSQPNER